MIWYKWVFYNDDDRCAIVNGTCLQDEMPIDGNEQPESYTTSYMWEDYYSRSEIETVFWIMLLTSFMGWVAWPTEIACAYGFVIYMAIISFQKYYNA